MTEARLMLLPLDRYIQPKGPPILLPPEALEFTRSRVATLIRRRGRTRPI